MEKERRSRQIRVKKEVNEENAGKVKTRVKDFFRQHRQDVSKDWGSSENTFTNTEDAPNSNNTSMRVSSLRKSIDRNSLPKNVKSNIKLMIMTKSKKLTPRKKVINYTSEFVNPPMQTKAPVKQIDEASETSDQIVNLKNMKLPSPAKSRKNSNYGINNISVENTELSKHHELLINYRLEAIDRKTPNIYNDNFLVSKAILKAGSEMPEVRSVQAEGQNEGSQKSIPQFQKSQESEEEEAKEYMQMGKEVQRDQMQKTPSQLDSIDRNFTNSPIPVVKQEEVKLEVDQVIKSTPQRVASTMETVDPLELQNWNYNDRQKYYKLRQEKRKQEEKKAIEEQKQKSVSPSRSLQRSVSPSKSLQKSVSPTRSLNQFLSQQQVKQETNIQQPEQEELYMKQTQNLPENLEQSRNPVEEPTAPINYPIKTFTKNKSEHSLISPTKRQPMSEGYEIVVDDLDKDSSIKIPSKPESSQKIIRPLDPVNKAVIKTKYSPKRNKSISERVKEIKYGKPQEIQMFKTNKDYVNRNMRQSSLKRYHNPYKPSRGLSEESNRVGFMNKSIISSPSKKVNSEKSAERLSTYQRSARSYKSAALGTPYRDYILRDKPKREILSSKTQKILLQKFNKEFITILSGIIGKDQIPLLIEKDVYKQFMKEMGFIKNYHDEAGGINHLSPSGQIVATKESVLINEIWTFLGQCYKFVRIKQNGVQKQPEEKVSVGDIKIFLMAILAIKGNKRLGLTAPEKNEDSLQYGWLNDQDQLCLSQFDMSKIQAKFSLLSSNRINFIGTKMTDRKKSCSKQPVYSFKPNLEASSQSVTKALGSARKKIESPTRKMVDNSAENLRKKELQNELKKKINQLQEDQKCTFTPNIAKSQKIIQAVESPPKSSGVQKKDFISFYRGEQSSSYSKKSRYEQLYDLSLNKDIAAITQEQRKYDKEKQECTFKPAINKSNSPSKVNSGLLFGRRQEQLKYQTPVLKQVSPRKYLSVNKEGVMTDRQLQSIQSDSERKRKAQKEKEYLSKCHSEGKFPKNATSSEFSKDEKQRKINDSVNRLYGKEKSPEPRKKYEAIIHSKSPPVSIQEDRQILNHILGTSTEAIPFNESQSPSSLKKVYGVKQSNLDRFLAPVLKKPLLFIDIDIQEDQKQSDRIVVYPGDSPRELASAFCIKHQLDEETKDLLVQQLNDKITKVNKAKEDKKSRITHKNPPIFKQRSPRPKKDDIPKPYDQQPKPYEPYQEEEHFKSVRYAD